MNRILNPNLNAQDAARLYRRQLARDGVHDETGKVSFWHGFIRGAFKVAGVIGCCLAACQTVYALGWALSYAMTRAGTTEALPKTAWFFAADASYFVGIAGIDALIVLAVLGCLFGGIAELGGWRWPAAIRNIFERSEVAGS